MAIKLINVKLKDGVDQNSFVSEFDSVSEVTVKNLLPNIPTLVIFNVEESYLTTLQSHSSVESAEVEPEAFPAVTYPSLPSTYSLSNKTVALNLVYGSVDGTNYISLMPTNIYGINDNFDLDSSHVLPALLRKIHLGKCLQKNHWNLIIKDIKSRPLKYIPDLSSKQKIYFQL